MSSGTYAHLLRNVSTQLLASRNDVNQLIFCAACFVAWAELSHIL